MNKKEESKGDWMVWLNGFGYIQVSCSKCGYRVPYDEEIPDKCPKCGSRNE